MLPKWHIIYGAIFTIIIAIAFPLISVPYLLLIFLSSVLIDFDHYVVGAMKIRRWDFGEVLRYHDLMEVIQQDNKRAGIKHKGDFHLFHTVEFHVLVLLLGLLWIGFFYVFLGMLFHSILDIIDMKRRGLLHVREFWFVKWLEGRVRFK